MRRLLIAALIALVAVVGGDSAFAAQGPRPDEQIVQVPAPAPGHTSEWSMRVRIGPDGLVDPSLVLREADGEAIAGKHPLELTLTAPLAGDVSGSVPAAVLATGTADELLGRAIALGTAEAASVRSEDGWLTVNAAATLPRAAGNEYRGAEATLRFRFSAAVDADLAMTGSAPLLVWVVVIAVLTAGIGATLIRRRGNRTERTSA